jgi:hypothetical protein
MNYTILGSAPSVSQEVIDQLAEDLKVTFPEEYTRFLLVSNGGRPRPKCFLIKTPEGNRVGQVLDFFGVNDPVESCDLRWNREVFIDRMPFSIFPIGCEDGGNVICIGVDASNLGRIYYWDHEVEGDQPSFDNVYNVNDSFSEFMLSLYDHESEI